MLVSKEKGVKTFIDNIMTQSSGEFIKIKYKLSHFQICKAVLQDKTRLDFVHSLACFARYADVDCSPYYFL